MSKSIWRMAIFGVIVVLLLLLVVALLGSDYGNLVGSEDAGEASSAEVDFPVVVAVKGGMLEVAQVKGRRSFPKSTDPVVLGKSIPFCREKASWTVPYAITYRLKLEERWTLRYRNGTLFAQVPELEPALPVAIDTTRLEDGAEESCWFVPDLGTRDRALRSIGPDLARVAKEDRTKRFARERARQTVREFLRTWTLNQGDYDRVAPDADIRVIFPGE